jgi:glycosyltransferase involved in cell wall biosynthesis
VVSISRGWTAESLRVAIYEKLDRLLLGWMTGIICVSQAQSLRVRDCGVRAEKVTVIRNAVRVSRFDDATETSRSRSRAALLKHFCQKPDLLVGSAGRLSPEKGHQLLVEAVPFVLERFPSVGFVIAGDGPLESALRGQIASRGLVDRVVLLGFRDDFDKVLPALDVMVLPSYTEGLPNVVLEAMAAGVPVVASAVGGTPELVQEGQTGLLCPPGDVQTLVKKLVSVLSSKETRDKLANAGRRLVNEEFSFEDQAQKYLAFFSVLANSPWKATYQSASCEE